MKVHLTAIALISAFAAVVFSVGQALATQYQQCATNETCIVGEFLYDDDYTPLTGASCTLNVKNPSGTPILNNVAMTGASDGWYSYNVSVGNDTGLYRSQICCNASGDYLCIDKSFEVAEGVGAIAQETANAVWANSGRTNFVTEIWNYSSDSLGSFASKITSIFNRSQTIENNLNSANTKIDELSEDTQNQINNLSNQTTNQIDNQTNSLSSLVTQTNSQSQTRLAGLLSDNKELLEQLLNAPIIQNFIPDDDVIPLTEKVDSASAAVNQIYAATQTIKGKLTTLLAKWPTLTTTKIDEELTTTLELIGTSSDTTAQRTLMSSLNALSQAWSSPLIASTTDAARTVVTGLGSTQQTLLSDGSSTGSFQDSLLETLDLVAALEDSVGDTSDSLSATTLYGFLKKIQANADAFGTSESDIDQLIKNLDQFSDRELKRELDKLTTSVLSQNQIKGAEILLTDPTNPDAPHPKFVLYGLKGIIALNRSGISGDTNTVSGLWLQDQDGSMFVRGFLYNPSSVQQTRQLRYALPIEVGIDQILAKSDNLVVEYDQAEAGMVAGGNFTLSPQELTTFFVQFPDLWLFGQDQIESTAKQAQDLVNSLRRTALFAQANTIKSDIEVSLDKIKLKLSGFTSPEERIAAVRSAQLDLLAIQEKLNTLKDMVSETSAAKSIVGAVGGIQAVAVWGLILMFAAGFVFLVVFMRRMQPVGAGIGIRRSVIAHPIPLSQNHFPSRVRVPRMAPTASDFAPSLPRLNTPYGKLALTILMTIGLATVVVSLIVRTNQPAAQTTTPSDPKLQAQGLQFGTDSDVIANPSDTVNSHPEQSEGSTTTSPRDPNDVILARPESASGSLPTSPTSDSEIRNTVLGSQSPSEMIVSASATNPTPIYASPSESAKIVMSLTESQSVYVFEVKSDPATKTSFSRIGFSDSDDAKSWWLETTQLSSPN